MTWSSGKLFDNSQTQAVLHGFTQMSLDPVLCATAFTPTAATIYLQKIPCPYGLTVANLSYIVTTSGTGATAISNAQVGVISSNGTLLGASADASASFDETSLTLKTIAVTAISGQSLVIPAGPTAFFWAALHIGVQASTAVQVRASAVSAVPTANANLGVTVSRTGSYPGHASNALATILSSPMTVASITGLNQLVWVGVS